MNMEIELERSDCPMGCPVGDSLVLVGKDLIHSIPGTFNVVRCRTCGLMRTSPRPTPETIGAYYPDNYGPYLGTQVVRIEQNRRRFSSLRAIAKRLFILKSNCLPSLEPGRMLEIGCASGGFMHEMAKKGWEVEGVEFSPKAAEAARALGYAVHTGGVESAPSPKEPYDLIVGWMVLEHLHEPVFALRKLHDWAKPGATLAISVPNAGTWQFRLFLNKWYPLQLPTHLTHFTPETARMVLAKGGWVVSQVHFQRVLADPIASLGHVLQGKGFKMLGKYLVGFTEGSEIWTALLYPIAWIASALGQTGRMTIWAKRAE